MTRTRAVVILSGGMDSSTLLHYVAKTEDRDLIALTVNYGQTHSREIECAIAQVKSIRREVSVEHIVLDLSNLATEAFRSALTGFGNIPDLDDVVGHPQPPTYVPHRNLILLAIGAGVAESHKIDRVYYGAQSADLYGYWDTTPDFLLAINGVLSLNRDSPVEVIAPFLMMKKKDILRLGMKLGVDFGQTFSCYRGGEEACGECATCRERLRAFRDLDLIDPIPYKTKKEAT